MTGYGGDQKHILAGALAQTEAVRSADKEVWRGGQNSVLVGVARQIGEYRRPHRERFCRGELITWGHGAGFPNLANRETTNSRNGFGSVQKR